MNQPANRRTLKQYLKRMHIEQSFRDDKSGSFDLEATKLTEPERLNHLLLAVAVAVLWIYDIGEQVLRAGDRQEINPAHRRQLSVFKSAGASCAAGSVVKVQRCPSGVCHSAPSGSRRFGEIVTYTAQYSISFSTGMSRSMISLTGFMWQWQDGMGRDIRRYAPGISSRAG